MHSGSGLVHTLPKMDHLRPSIALLLQLGVLQPQNPFYGQPLDGSGLGWQKRYFKATLQVLDRFEDVWEVLLTVSSDLIGIVLPS